MRYSACTEDPRDTPNYVLASILIAHGIHVLVLWVGLSSSCTQKRAHAAVGSTVPLFDAVQCMSGASSGVGEVGEGQVGGDRPEEHPPSLPWGHEDPPPGDVH